MTTTQNTQPGPRLDPGVPAGPARNEASMTSNERHATPDEIERCEQAGAEAYRDKSRYRVPALDETVTAIMVERKPEVGEPLGTEIMQAFNRGWDAEQARYLREQATHHCSSCGCNVKSDHVQDSDECRLLADERAMKRQDEWA